MKTISIAEPEASFRRRAVREVEFDEHFPSFRLPFFGIAAGMEWFQSAVFRSR
jgi:hypothetical protein